MRGADIAFYSTDRIPESGYAVAFWGAPDLAVEILSPTERPGEAHEKIREYLAAGARQVWVVDPRARSFTVHRPDEPAAILGENDVLDGGDVVPGFRLRLASYFAT